METNEQIFDLVEQYLAGAMSAKELEAFEARRKSDPAFAEEVLEHLRARASIRAAGRERLKDNFEAVYEAQMSKRFRSMLWRVAAGFAALIVSGILLWQFLPQPSPQELYAQHVSIPTLPGIRGQAPVDSAAWEDALRGYEQGNYAESARLLAPFVANDTFRYHSFAAFHQGIAFLKLEESSEAIKRFEMVERPGLYAEQADWYIALAHLQAGDKVSARAALEAIVAKPGHYQREKAEEVLGEL